MSQVNLGEVGRLEHYQQLNMWPSRNLHILWVEWVWKLIDAWIVALGSAFRGVWIWVWKTHNCIMPRGDVTYSCLSVFCCSWKNGIPAYPALPFHWLGKHMRIRLWWWIFMNLIIAMDACVCCNAYRCISIIKIEMKWITIRKALNRNMHVPSVHRWHFYSKLNK